MIRKALHHTQTKLCIVAALYLVIFSSSGCKVMKPAPLPAVKQLPVRYTAVTSSNGSAKLDFKYLFRDTLLIRFIDSALQQNTNLRKAVQRIGIARARLIERKSAFLPSVDGIVSIAADKYGKYTQNGVGNFDTNLSPNIDTKQRIPVSPTTDWLIGISSTWELDLWGKLKHLKKAALANLLASEKGKQLLVTTLVASLAEGYYNLLELDTELKIVRKNIELQKKALEVVEAQKEGGRANELAVQQFRAQLLNTKAIEYLVIQERLKLENELNAMAGFYPHTIQRDTALPQSAATTISAGVPAALLANRPDILEAEHAMQAANENVLAARAAFLPSLVISPYVALNAFTPALLMKSGSAAYGIAGSLMAPLFQKKQLQAQFSIANAANIEAVLNYQQQLLNAYSEVETGVNAVHNIQLAHSLKAEEVQQLNAAVVTSKELYLTGYANYLEVITAQKNVLEAELQLAALKRDIFVSLVKLYRALGGGWVAYDK